MSDFASIALGTIRGEPLLLQDFLGSLKRSGRLGALLEEAARDKVLEQTAAQGKIAVEDADLQRAADKWRSAVGLFRAEDTRKWLARQRMSELDLDALILRHVWKQKLEERIPRAKVEEFFTTNRALFDRAQLSHLIVDREGLAGELLSQIQEEERDFAELVRKHSIHADSRNQGGSLGVVPRRTLPTEMAALVFAAKPGTVVGPVRMALGYHLVKVEELLPGQLDQATENAIREQMFNAWLEAQVRQGLKSEVWEQMSG
jgi:parvulin-like peptidyl-prolyl isomerase